MTAMYRKWLATNEGRSFLVLSRKHSKASPYYHGFVLPDYVRDIIKALGENDEVLVKHLVYVHIVSCQ